MIRGNNASVVLLEDEASITTARVIEHLAAAIVHHRNDTYSNAAANSLSTGGNADENEDQPVSVPKKRIQVTAAQKRAQMEEATRFAQEDTERRRLHNSLKTARLRALRLSLKI